MIGVDRQASDGIASLAAVINERTLAAAFCGSLANADKPGFVYKLKTWQCFVRFNKVEGADLSKDLVFE